MSYIFSHTEKHMTDLVFFYVTGWMGREREMMELKSCTNASSKILGKVLLFSFEQKKSTDICYSYNNAVLYNILYTWILSPVLTRMNWLQIEKKKTMQR